MNKLNGDVKNNIRVTRESNNKKLKFIDIFFDNIRKPFFILFMLFHVLYFIILIGLFSVGTKYVEMFNTYINYFAQIFISLYLLIRFNPFRTYECKSTDSIVIFWSALFLIFNLGVIKYIETLLLKNSTVDKVYTGAKTTVDTHSTNFSNFLKRIRENIFGPDPPPPSETDKPNETKLPPTSETKQPQPPPPPSDKDKAPAPPPVNVDLVSTDNTIINNPNNELKYVPFLLSPTAK